MTRRKKNTLTPVELFDHRLAALLGYADIDLMKRSMTYRMYLNWQKYWEEEPWGPWRDNFHAAMLAREVRRTVFKSGLELNRFMYTNPNKRVKEVQTTVMAALGAMATKVSAKEAQKRLKTARQRRTIRKKRK